MSLLPPETVRKLQETLHAKAKREPTYRFYALYDKIYRADVLNHAYLCCAANDGAPGVDGQTFADIEAYGVDRWVRELTEELRNKTYHPQAVRRVYIPKADGKQRPLGIPMGRAYCTSSQATWGFHLGPLTGQGKEAFVTNASFPVTPVARIPPFPQSDERCFHLRRAAFRF
jgi:hypothetical protein